jgi:hypothetical protein
VIRKFCGNCGCSLFSDLGASPAITIVKAGTVDAECRKLIPAPSRQVWCDSHQDWFDPSSMKGVEMVAKN